MAHDNVEIEIKVPVDKDTFLSVKEKLQKLAVFDKNSHQEDSYFTPSHRDFLSEKFPFEWLRIGKRGNKVIVNYKNWQPNGAEIHTHCDEYDVEVDDADKIELLFNVLNFQKLCTVEKQREVFVFDDEFEVCLDKVTDLGHFIEIETIKDFGSIDLARKKLFELAERLGIDASNPDQRGYPFLLMQKNGLIE